MINPAEVLSPNAQTIDHAMYEVLSKSPQKVAILSEYLTKLNEPPGELERDAIELIEKKYSDRHIDLIVARGERSLEFIERNGKAIWPDVPVMYYSLSSPAIYWRKSPQKISGVFIDYDYAANLALIMRLQPSVKHIIQLVESPHPEEIQQLHTKLAALAKARQADLHVDTIGERPLADLLNFVTTLPPDTVLLAMTIDGDRDGVRYSTDEIVRAISEKSSVPMYGMRGSYMGNGVVGGQVINLSEHGREAGQLALQLLSNPKRGPYTQISQRTRCVIDDRQIARWGFNFTDIPDNCERPFHIPTFWERNAMQIIAFVLMTAVILLLIFGFQWQRKKRLRADEEANRQRTALAHVARLGSVGELTASIVHEINQPLGAILANADAATMMLNQQSHPDHELRAILADIRDDNLRASLIIQKLRVLLSKRSLESKPVSLNEVIDTSRSLLGNLAIKHHVMMAIELAPDLPMIMGDSTHLQQVLINLASNAMEAMEAVPPAQRTLSIKTEQCNASHIRLIVADKGPGIPTNILPNIFESFYTTKPEGMGMGLAIVQTIVDAHCGLIETFNDPAGGAAFVITFPIAKNGMRA
ncbi:two-component sensor histidine kinase [Janthinobacterium sp. Marseille]|nr:two-component sensor histidine kinase [Janthinobacterium sp. Marseille]